MQKLLKISLAILIIILLCYFPQYLSHKQSGNIDGSSMHNSSSYTSDSIENELSDTTSEIIPEEISSDESADNESFTQESTVEETTTEEITTNEIIVPNDILISNTQHPASLQFHDKNVMVYGDINPNSEDVIKLQQTLQSYNKNISLAVWRTDNAKALTYNTNQTYFSACTIKIAYVLACCKVIDNGYADENTMLTYQERHYHQGSGKIRKSEYGTSYSIKDLINLSLSISDNVAYKMLLEHFGLQTYNSIVKSLGCNSLIINRMWGSRVNVNDYITLWNEVYNYFSSGAKMSEHLKNSCTNTPFNYGTKTLTNIDYSHKSGDNFGESAVYNDAGIVWGDNHYIYAVFTNSEGTSYDIQTVNTVMEMVHKIMTN
ncbi:MAG: serine hydrolase [Lachnospiraceae bacterium]|nr:serine hydrolase [Lachnospiraceae bacterium]